MSFVLLKKRAKKKEKNFEPLEKQKEKNDVLIENKEDKS